jgi:hypothetical protein
MLDGERIRSADRQAVAVCERLALLLAALRGVARDRTDLVAEHLLLRHQLAVLTRPTRETVLTPARAPRANAIAERVVRALRNDGLDYLIPLDGRHLRTMLAEYVAAYSNSERPHRGLGLEPPLRPARPTSGPIRAQSVPGGLHHAYRRAA